MDATTARLVDFAMGSSFAAVPEATVHECKRRLIDTFGCAIAAYDEPLCAMARTVASQVSSTTPASIWGSPIKTTPEAAAFANGVMVRFLDLSDTYLAKSRGHPSDMTSGILAAAEAEHASGEAVIDAVVLAYDIYCSFCQAVDVNAKGWDQPLYAILGCVLAVGKLMRLSREEMGNAVSLALAPNMALGQTRQGDLSSWKGCAGANAARNAVFAATLARLGFTGPSAVFEGKRGLWNVVGTFEWVLPRESHMITETHVKSVPVCYHGQAAVISALELRPRVELERISEIRIDGYGAAVAMMGNESSRWAPTTRETADHSMPYCVAIALLDGSVSGKSFDEKRFTDPAVVGLMQKVKVFEDAELDAQYPEGAPNRVTIRMSDGETHRAEMRYPTGHARNPIGDAALEEKFSDMVSGRMNGTQCKAVLRKLWDFDQARDVGELIRLFADRAALS
jgi:2-methylcitrate dehydratase